MPGAGCCCECPGWFFVHRLPPLDVPMPIVESLETDFFAPPLSPATAATVSMFVSTRRRFWVLFWSGIPKFPKDKHNENIRRVFEQWCPSIETTLNTTLLFFLWCVSIVCNTVCTICLFSTVARVFSLLETSRWNICATKTNSGTIHLLAHHCCRSVPPKWSLFGVLLLFFSLYPPLPPPPLQNCCRAGDKRRHATRQCTVHAFSKRSRGHQCGVHFIV